MKVRRTILGIIAIEGLLAIAAGVAALIEGRFLYYLCMFSFVFWGIIGLENLARYSQKTSSTTTAQPDTKETKIPDLHIKSTAQHDKVIMTGCPAEMEDLYGKDSFCVEN